MNGKASQGLEAGWRDREECLFLNWNQNPAGEVQNRRQGRSLMLVWACVLALFLGSHEAIAAARSLSIADARQQPNGVEVVLQGLVTVPSQQFASANLDRGFALQDETGGIYVSTLIATDFQVGTLMQVIGTLEDDGHGQRRLSLKSWQVKDAPPTQKQPKRVSLQEAGQKMDGTLVTVQGQITRPLVEDAPYGDRLWIQDETGEIQVYIAKSTEIEPQTLPFLTVGTPIEVTGLSSQFDAADEIMPRTAADIRPLKLAE